MRKSIVRSGHDFVDATTAEMLWHVQNCDLIEGLQSNLDSNEFSKDFDLWFKFLYSSLFAYKGLTLP